MPEPALLMRLAFFAAVVIPLFAAWRARPPARWRDVLGLLALSLCVGASLVEFGNFTAIGDDLETSFTAKILLWAALIFALAAWMAETHCASPRTSAPASHIRSLPVRSTVMGIGLLAAAFFALRTDSLFIGSTEYHWSYFVGPIRTVRAGGVLLYDTPSQYGFLNILLPAMLPIASAWSSFYAFQAALLWVTGVLFLRAIALSTQNSLIRGFLAIPIFGLVFLVDPALIGAHSYPSASVIRFFPCLLTALLALNPVRIRLFGRSAALDQRLGYLLALVWSAETMLFAACGVSAEVAAKAMLERDAGIASCLTRASGRILRVGGAFVVALLVFVALFFAAYGVLPDPALHFLYVFGYGSGYQAWLLPLGFSSGLGLIAATALAAAYVLGRLIRDQRDGKENQRELVTATAVWLGLLLGTASYYYGRPVYSNVLSLLAMLCGMGLLVAERVRSAGRDADSLLLRAAILPAVVLVCLGTFARPAFYKDLPTMAAGGFDIEAKLRPTSPAFVQVEQVIASHAKSGLAAISYCGGGGLLPRSSLYRHPALLFEPFQLVDQPIRWRSADKILERTLKRNDDVHGFFIVDGELPLEVCGPLLSALETRARMSRILENKAYRVYEMNGLK